MKFGRKLTESAHPSFRNYYIAYKDLKAAIKVITGQENALASPLLEGRGGIARSPESQFQELLDGELSKINNFANVQFSVLMEEIRELLYRLTHDEPSAGGLLDSLRYEVVAFDEYIRLNFSGFRKALKKFDKWNQSDSSNWFLQRVVRSDFMLVHIDRLMHGVALAGRMYRQVTIGNFVSYPTTPPIRALQQPHTCYFVSPEEFVPIEAELMKNMDPVYVFPLAQTAPSSTDALIAKYLTPSRNLKDSGEISQVETVVLFDRGFQQYAVRRAKRPVQGIVGGFSEPVFSARWTAGQARENRCSLVRESHPKWVSNGEVMEVELGQKFLLELIAGKATVDVTMEGRDLLDEFIKYSKRFSPSALCSYRRTLFQAYQEPSIVVALDRDIKFADLTDVKSSFFSVPPTQFQSVLTQRTMTVWTDKERTPDWLKSVLGRPSVSEVVGFSKAVHAEAVLHVVTEIDRPVSVGLPHWFLHTISGADDLKSKFANMMSMAGEDDLMASPMITATTGKFDILPSGSDLSSKQLIHDIVSQQRSESIRDTDQPHRIPAPMGSSDLEVPLLERPQRAKSASSRSIWAELKFVLFGSLAPEIPVPLSSKIEPKTFLANERTFLNWCFVAFIISAVAITLVSVDPSASMEAACLSLVAIVTIGWSLNVYRLRVIALRNMKSLDKLLVTSNGATAVALSVVFALLITWTGRFRQYMDSD